MLLGPRLPTNFYFQPLVMRSFEIDAFLFETTPSRNNLLVKSPGVLLEQIHFSRAAEGEEHIKHFEMFSTTYFALRLMRYSCMWLIKMNNL